MVRATSPDTAAMGRAPRPASGVRMSDAPEQHPEPAPASQAPAIIQLGPPAAPPPKARHGSEERKRLHVKRSRYDDAELAEFEARARACGLSDGAFIRASTLGDAGPRAR